jgi:putative tryptophan/tyrosine transport system substrate-binding protein
MRAPMFLMKSRCVLVAVMVAALSLPATPAARPTKPVRIAILTSAWSPWHTNTEGFRDGLKDLGYSDSTGVTFDVRAAQGDPTRLPELAAELVKHSPDVLYCAAGPDAVACQKATRTVPIIFTQAGDPVKLGLVRTLARPGGNITGIGSLRAELSGKRLELFKEVVPSLRRALVTYDVREAEERDAVASARAVAGRLGVEVLERSVTATLEMEPGLAALKQGGSDGILIVQSGLNLNIPGRSLEVATSNKIPTMYPASFWSKFGALASYGPDQYLQGRQAARLAARILSGTRPGDLPVELPDRIEFIVNVKTARALGFEIPRTVLLRVDRVIEQ